VPNFLLFGESSSDNVQFLKWKRRLEFVKMCVSSYDKSGGQEIGYEHRHFQVKTTDPFRHTGKLTLTNTRIFYIPFTEYFHLRFMTFFPSLYFYSDFQNYASTVFLTFKIFFEKIYFWQLIL